MFDRRKLPDLCIGTVTVITSNNLILTGIINLNKNNNMNGNKNCEVKPNPNCIQNYEVKTNSDKFYVHEVEPKDEEEFITLTLNEPLLVIPGSGTTALVQPFYVSGDTIRINLDQIETIGPAHP